MLRAFHHPDCDLHQPLYRIAGGVLQPTFETPERTRLLREGLRSIGVTPEHARVANLDEQLLRVHTLGYLDFLRDGFAEWCQNPGNGPEMRTSMHTTRYMGRRPHDLIGRAGYYQADSSSVIVEGTWASVRASAAVAIAATEAAITEKKAVYAMSRPPGHHAYHDQAGGFCYLNNAALAAEAAVARGARVAVLDLDVHHGNGTQHIFYERDDVLTVSLHGDPKDLYPFYAGYSDEVGTQAGEGKNLNLPLPLMSGYQVYAKALARAVHAIEQHGTEVLVIALGLDAFRGDPFACMALEVDDFRRLGASSRLDMPTIVVQEGGYPSPHLGNLLRAFLSGLSE